MLRFFYTLPLILLTKIGFSQFNDSTKYYINFVSSGSINKTQDGSSYLLNNGFQFQIRKEAIESNFYSNWIYGKQNQKLSNNDFSTTLDFNIYNRKASNLYYWGLANYNTSYSLKINNQLLTGVGLAYNIINKNNQKLNISDGILFDRSDIMLTDNTQEIYSTWRNSFRLSFKFVINKIFTLQSTSFIQNSLDKKADYIIKSNNGLSIKLTNWLSFETKYTFNKISRTKRENQLFSYGLKLEKYF
ncbi:DUF481 domain-containing protein [Pseudopedobacter sp.]|uniref:DUF481 domain-containing protein n=1 Tax=Pseudopedobacter sp. TaxID=1936787 RepID=UPI00333EB124